MNIQFEQLKAAIKAKKKESVQGVGSSNSNPELSLQSEIPIQTISLHIQWDMTPPKQESTRKEMTPQNPVYFEVDKQIRVDVSNFDGE